MQLWGAKGGGQKALFPLCRPRVRLVLPCQPLPPTRALQMPTQLPLHPAQNPKHQEGTSPGMQHAGNGLVCSEIGMKDRGL